MRFIWATRGFTWGFRFLRTGGFADPLPEYSKAFDAWEGAVEVCQRMGDVLVLRFEDPLARRDRSGRTIPHDFVLYGFNAASPLSAVEATELVWPLVEDEYARSYDLTAPPKANGDVPAAWSRSHPRLLDLKD